jgi:hypothetical protein
MKYCAVLLCLSSVAPALADGCDDNLDVSKTPVVEVLKCLKSELKELRGKKDIPAGAVVAFAIEDGCPAGWTSYSNAAGRVILGAGQGTGLTRRGYLLQEGSESVNLRMENLPAQKIKTNGMVVNASRTDRYNAGGKDYVVSVVSNVPIETDALGSDKPISVMPPFVALNYCKKNAQ